MSIFSDNL